MEALSPSICKPLLSFLLHLIDKCDHYDTANVKNYPCNGRHKIEMDYKLLGKSFHTLTSEESGCLATDKTKKHTNKKSFYWSHRMF